MKTIQITASEKLFCDWVDGQWTMEQMRWRRIPISYVSLDSSSSSDARRSISFQHSLAGQFKARFFITESRVEEIPNDRGIRTQLEKQANHFSLPHFPASNNRRNVTFPSPVQSQLLLLTFPSMERRLVREIDLSEKLEAHDLIFAIYLCRPIERDAIGNQVPPHKHFPCALFNLINSIVIFFLLLGLTQLISPESTITTTMIKKFTHKKVILGLSTAKSSCW